MLMFLFESSIQKVILSFLNLNIILRGFLATNWALPQKQFFPGQFRIATGSDICELTRQKYRVIVMRAEKRERPLFEDKHDYYGFITNIFHGEMKDEQLLAFYRARGNCENYIKELKNGFDIHHFPCKKLMANRAYGLIAAFAYNYMRLASFTLGDKRPRFSKMLRFRTIHIACQVVMTARRVIFRFNQHRKKEVEHWITLTHQQFGSG